MDASSVLERLRALPAGARLLDALDGLTGVHLVGGAVRDLLVGRSPRDLDLVAEEEGVAVAEELARRWGAPPPVVHGRFGTATVDGVNVATARAESYPRPGALPEVRAGTLDEDMARRDFTVNAIAVGVSPDVLGRVHAVPGALEDLDARRLRVLHDASFLDDPTRLTRLARYAGRLGFEVEEGTARLAREAFAAGAPATAGRARMGNELLLALHEPDPIAALTALRDLAAPTPLDPPGFDVDPDLMTRAAALLPGDPLVLLAAATVGVERDELAEWLGAIHLSEAPVVLDAVDDPAGLAASLRAASRPSELWRLLHRRTSQAVALAGAVGKGEGAEAAARLWLDDLRHVRLAITGDDLLRAGVPQGRDIGEGLDRALARKLDGEAPTREEELAAALEGRA